mmetsp:Transcript_45555/g.98661  ORF Transcript_45555/g.98661 Transcript_45555/m.98661 type:complete len:291 (-) Transcript_45555:58-930(-)
MAQGPGTQRNATLQALYDEIRELESNLQTGDQRRVGPRTKPEDEGDVHEVATTAISGAISEAIDDASQSAAMQPEVPSNTITEQNESRDSPSRDPPLASPSLQPEDRVQPEETPSQRFHDSFNGSATSTSPTAEPVGRRVQFADHLASPNRSRDLDTSRTSGSSIERGDLVAELARVEADLTESRKREQLLETELEHRKTIIREMKEIMTNLLNERTDGAGDPSAEPLTAQLAARKQQVVKLARQNRTLVQIVSRYEQAGDDLRRAITTPCPNQTAASTANTHPTAPLPH